MARRRRGSSGDTDPATEQDPPLKPGDGPQVEMRMRGTADQVKQQLGVAAAASDEKPKPSRATEAIEEAERFFNELRNPAYIVKVKRLRPKEWQGRQANVEVWTSELPLQWEEIRTEVSKSAGGGTYKVSVINPETGAMVTARNFEVEGDPILETQELTAAEQEMFGAKEKDAATITEEGLERTARMTAKQIEVETYQQQLRELRSRGGGGKADARDDGRINDLERRLTEAKHQAELEARDRRHQEEMKELKNLIAQNQKPVQQGPSEISLLIAQMQKAQESSDKRFEALQKQMQDDKLNMLLQKIDNLEKRPTKDKTDMVEMAESMLTLKKVFGWGGNDDPDDDDPDDDRPWWQKALDKLGDKITPKVIDKIFAKLDGLENSGKTVTKEDFMKINEEEIAAHARKVADEEIRRLMAQQEPQKPAALPAPAPAPVSLPPPPQKVELPPAASAPEAAQVPPPSIPPPPQQMTVAQKICTIAAGAVMMISDELALMPNNFEWPWNLWDGLPAAMLERVCTAPDPVSMFDAFKVEGLKVDELEKMKTTIAADPKAIAWLELGLKDLRGWWVEKQKNPSFDPQEEGEEE